ncbi:hypothetical protein EJ08DRAFT_208450 [Tothia fuscella]|uniref:Uncharacterized protein n=1 Tax=Tothia fuscella TaxID=1048955 RepID=A0A9P4NTC5_9PEZI|nr:hypothetical protein EJ08DRAFT_208450 [Tothia fuscella]
MEPLILPKEHEMQPYRSKGSIHAPIPSSNQPRDSKCSQSVSKIGNKREFPHSIRICLRVVSLLLSISIIGIIIHTILVYNKDPNISWVYPHGNRLRAFPSVVVMKPTYFMLAAAILATILSILALITLLGCFKHIRKAKLGPIAGLGSTATACVVWVVAMVYFKIWDSKSHTQNDLWSWTCTHKYITIERPDRTISFHAICQQMSATFYAGILIAVLEFINFAALS